MPNPTSIIEIYINIRPASNNYLSALLLQIIIQVPLHFFKTTKIPLIFSKLPLRLHNFANLPKYLSTSPNRHNTQIIPNIQEIIKIPFKKL